MESEGATKGCKKWALELERSGPQSPTISRTIRAETEGTMEDFESDPCDSVPPAVFGQESGTLATWHRTKKDHECFAIPGTTRFEVEIVGN